MISSSLINFLGREDKGRAPRIDQGPAGGDRGAVSGRSGPEHLQHLMQTRSHKQVQSHRIKRCQVCRSLFDRKNNSWRRSKWATQVNPVDKGWRRDSSGSRRSQGGYWMVGAGLTAWWAAGTSNHSDCNRPQAQKLSFKINSILN